MSLDIKVVNFEQLASIYARDLRNSVEFDDSRCTEFIHTLHVIFPWLKNFWLKRDGAMRFLVVNELDQEGGRVVSKGIQAQLLIEEMVLSYAKENFEK